MLYWQSCRITIMSIAFQRHAGSVTKGLASGCLIVPNSCNGTKQTCRVGCGFMEFVSTENSVDAVILTSPIAGSGKTILAAGIVDHLCLLPRGAGTSISYFFCSFSDPTSREPQTILRCLIKQILNILDETPEIGETLKSLYLKNHREPTIGELSRLFASVARLPRTAYLLVDGLDECGDSDRRQVLSCC